MKTLCTVVLLTVVHCWLASAQDPIAAPKDVPPVLGTAVVINGGLEDEFSEWRISLTVPKVRWKIAGEMIPKQELPRLEAELEQKTLILRMDAAVQLPGSRVVNLKGEDLSREELIKRLAKETPVLVSLSNKMPDAYFLQLTNPDALIVILGYLDGYPTPDLLPSEKASAPTKKRMSDPHAEPGVGADLR